MSERLTPSGNLLLVDDMNTVDGHGIALTRRQAQRDIEAKKNYVSTPAAIFTSTLITAPIGAVSNVVRFSEHDIFLNGFTGLYTGGLIGAGLFGVLFALINWSDRGDVRRDQLKHIVKQEMKYEDIYGVPDTAVQPTYHANRRGRRTLPPVDANGYIGNLTPSGSLILNSNYNPTGGLNKPINLKPVHLTIGKIHNTQP